ncbi:glycosyltransferase [Aeromicrobium sp.]|uniref:glycosyltransferase n=1 Tax=Aeromicrobium sp. TaxID=1871063 RepID=UPI002FCAC736
MKISLLCHGTRGDVQPHLAIADELRSRGHALSISANQDHTAVVQRLGFESHSYPVDMAAFFRTREAREFLASGRSTSAARAAARWEAASRTEMEDALVAACDGADLVVATGLTLSRAIAITERSGQRLAVLYMHPYWPTGDFPTPFLRVPPLPLPALNRLGHNMFQKAFEMSDRANSASMRRRLGLSGSSPGSFRYCRDNNVDVVNVFSPALVPPPADWPDNHHVVGSPVISPTVRAAFGENDPDASLTAWLDEADPPVFFGFGSMPVLDPITTMTMIVDVAERLGVRALVGAGWSEIPSGPSHDGRVYVSTGFDHDKVLPRCRAAVHHGGAGTTHTVVRAGIPAVIAHVFADQPFFGRQITRLGLGADLPFRRLDATRLHEALVRALAPELAQNAERYAELIATEDGVIAAADALART